MLSIVIPSHNDIYLHKTIQSLLDNSYGDIEIIPVLDGYEPSTPITKDIRVKPQHHALNMGMREAINTGVMASHGKYIMRSDEHCMFGHGYDTILTSPDLMQDNWIVTPRRYKLDPVEWRRMDEHGYIDYEKLIIKQKDGWEKLSGCYWRARQNERADIDIDETMMMQGSCWVMARSWWDKVIKRLDSDGYGPLYQDTTEMVFKTWLAGGKLMVNKKTWFAHKHRDFNRTHHYSVERAIPEWKFALDLWRDEYEKAKVRWQI